MNDDQKVEAVAKAAHNMLSLYGKVAGDHSVPDWEEAPAWQREATVRLVKAYLADEIPDAKAEHERWLAEKRAKGYVWGEKKNDDARQGPLTNPSLIDYDQQSLYLRMKTPLQLATVVGLCAHYGLKAGAKQPVLSFT